MVATQTPMQQLELVKEAKVFDILGGRLDPRLEASGVLAKDGLFYVIFDNLPHIACIGAELSSAAVANHVIEQRQGPPPRLRGHRVRPVERPLLRPDRVAAPRPRESSWPRYRSTTPASDISDTAWLDFPLDRPNKGLEGLTCVHRQGQTYLLGLCEGNRCKGGAAGRVPGGGRIHVFRRGSRHWDRVGKIRLAGDGPLRGLQRHRGERRPDRGRLPGLIGAVGWRPRAVRLAGHRHRHELCAPEGC